LGLVLKDAQFQESLLQQQLYLFRLLAKVYGWVCLWLLLLVKSAQLQQQQQQQQQLPLDVDLGLR